MEPGPPAPKSKRLTTTQPLTRKRKVKVHYVYERQERTEQFPFGFGGNIISIETLTKEKGRDLKSKTHK